MSDTILKLIPIAPTFVPPESRQHEALAALVKAFPEAEEPRAETYAEVTFIDNGENTEAIVCPSCGTRLPLDDDANAETNQELFSFFDGDETPITARLIPMPCCRKKVVATSLMFDWPAGFARFELSIRNPDATRPIDDAVRRRIEGLLGCAVHEIWAHY